MAFRTELSLHRHCPPSECACIVTYNAEPLRNDGLWVLMMALPSALSLQGPPAAQSPVASHVSLEPGHTLVECSLRRHSNVTTLRAPYGRALSMPRACHRRMQTGMENIDKWITRMAAPRGIWQRGARHLDAVRASLLLT